MSDAPHPPLIAIKPAHPKRHKQKARDYAPSPTARHTLIGVHDEQSKPGDKDDGRED